MMADDSQKKIKVVNTNVKKIFDTMEYGNVSDNTNLAAAWLKEQQKGIVYAYINKKEESCKNKSTQIKDVGNRETLVTVYSPNTQDVEKIILKCAENTKWALTAAIERAMLLERLAKEIERNSTLFCQLEISIRGILSADTKSKALPLLVEYLQYYGSWAIKHEKQDPSWNPKGITAAIISDESFLAVFGFVLGPALAAGYNVVLQTEPKISAIAALIIELAENVGIPEGVIKVIPGPVDLNCIFKNKDVTLISSFGNFYANKYNLERPLGKKFLAISSSSKAPMVVFNNGDLDSACDTLVDAAWGYQGMLPWSINTVIVQEDIFNAFVEKLKYCLSKVKMSSATDKLADVSYPLITDTKKQLQQFINEAQSQGIEIYQNNPQLEMFQPTLFIGERVFGNNVILVDRNLPVLTIRAFRTTIEAISLANNSRFGFGASVWTENIGLAGEVASKLIVSNVWINSYGHFSAATTTAPQKESGIGYFGGKEGFYEYINAKNSFKSQNTAPVVTSNLPQKTENVPLQSFYAGSFKKSESGLIDGVFDHLAGKDLYNAISAAKKGQEVWSTMALLERNLLLRKIANEISQSEDEKIKKWITATYEGVAQLNNLGNVATYKSRELRSCRKPIGVIAIEESGQTENTFISILGALLLGNSVIILNYDTNMSKFYVQICKIFATCSIPPGVFNVLLNCNNDILNMVLAHKELSAYFTSTCNDVLNKTKINDLKHFYPTPEDWSHILINATTIKNVWSNVGESVL